MKAKNGDGYIRKNKRGKYECTITSTCVDPITQNYKRIKRTADTREEAQKQAKKAMQAYEKEWREQNNYNDELTLLFWEACEEYLGKIVKPKVAQSTYYTYFKSYELYIKKYKSIANVQVRNLSKRDFERLYDMWTEKYSPKSIQYPLQLCRSVCKWLCERKKIDGNYAEEVKPIYEKVDEVTFQEEKKHKEILTKEDLKKIYDAYKANLNSDYIPVVLFLCETGLRPQEFACLTNSDINLQLRRMKVQRTSNRRFTDDTNTTTEQYIKITKTSEIREIMLSDLAVEMIVQMQLKTRTYCNCNDNNLLYPSFRNGKPRSNATMEVGFKHLCDMLDIDRDVHATRGGQSVGINLYCCRHTCETMMHSAGINVHVVAAMLGHTPETGLKHYTHLGIEDIEQQAKTPFMIMNEENAASNETKDSDANDELTKEQEIALLKKLLKKYGDEV